MTIREAFIAELDEISVPKATIEKTLIDHPEIDPDDDYEGGTDSKKVIDLCVIDVLYRLYTRSDIKEGDYSKSHPDFLRKIEKRLLYLANKYNVAEVLAVIQDPGPSISDNSFVW